MTEAHFSSSVFGAGSSINLQKKQKNCCVA